MKIIRNLHAMTLWSDRLRREGVTIGFVPTMGALHDGHRALIRAARLRCDALVVSIFVNPAQFGPKEDLSRYPRPIARDRRLCRAEGVDVCFEPTPADMYSERFQTSVMVPELAGRWEGTARPHHFGGVATVLVKLFSLVRPHHAVFGQKDFQQAALVRRLIADLNLAVGLTVHPTVREPDGLAMSSRNVYLSPDHRRRAPVLYRALSAGRQAILDGLRDGRQVDRIMKRMMAEDRIVRPEYLAVCDAASLEPLKKVSGSVVLLGAIRIGRVRLIDNVTVAVPSAGSARRGRRSA
ncbi:Pantothenate synthetase [Nitrospira japonica]|uniref:Pantothenate synthetase n=1 Tax=Nitrospira japonica TaxID=1325564 RepID=A0A1W1I3X9_9BACT|nr:pantoate--beta-alanine ligase [Nitrospira japonica]SLM47716.1 Pantothenate synthetase [Nitrospira japonica]